MDKNPGTLHDKIVAFLARHPAPAREGADRDGQEWIYGRRINEPPPKPAATDRKRKPRSRERNYSPVREDLLHFYAGQLRDYMRSSGRSLEDMAGELVCTSDALKQHLRRWGYQ